MFSKHSVNVVKADQLGDDLISSATSHPNGFWLSTDRFFSASVGHFVMPDNDPQAVCRDALATAATELEALLGRPSVCTTVPELRG